MTNLDKYVTFAIKHKLVIFKILIQILQGQSFFCDGFKMSEQKQKKKDNPVILTFLCLSDRDIFLSLSIFVRVEISEWDLNNPGFLLFLDLLLDSSHICWGWSDGLFLEELTTAVGGKSGFLLAFECIKVQSDMLRRLNLPISDFRLKQRKRKYVQK